MASTQMVEQRLSQASSQVVARLCGRMGERLLLEHPSLGVVEAETTLRFAAAELSAAIEARRRCLLVDGGDAWIVVGLLEVLPPAEQVGTEVDEQPLVINSRKGVILRCGEASVRLTPDGRVVVRGKDVVTRASRRNQVSGGSVRLN